MNVLQNEMEQKYGYVRSREESYTLWSTGDGGWWKKISKKTEDLETDYVEEDKRRISTREQIVYNHKHWVRLISCLAPIKENMDIKWNGGDNDGIHVTVPLI